MDELERGRVSFDAVVRHRHRRLVHSRPAYR